jgi:hypothetical protein
MTQPGVETPGYYRLSLRDKAAANVSFRSGSNINDRKLILTRGV